MAAAASRCYIVSVTRVAYSGSAPTTVIQVKAGATVPLQVIRATMSQTASTTSTQVGCDICRSTAGTVTAFTPLKTGPSTDPAASAVGGTSATGITCSSEGTPANILHQDAWNFLNGWLYLPTPKEYPFVDAATIINLRLVFPSTAAITLTSDLIFEEVA